MEQYKTLLWYFIGIIIFLFLEIYVILFPHKINRIFSIFFTSKEMLPFQLLPIIFSKSIAKKILKYGILKSLKIDFIPIGQISFDDFIKNYFTLFLIDKKISIEEQIMLEISNGKNRFILSGRGGQGKTLTAYKMIYLLIEQNYIPIILNEYTEKLSSSVTLNMASENMLMMINHQEYLFICNDMEYNQFQKLYNFWNKEFKNSIFILTTRYCDEEADINFNNFDTKILENNSLTKDFTINPFLSPFYLAIKNKYHLEYIISEKEILNFFIDKEISSVVDKLNILEPKKEYFRNQINLLLIGIAFCSYNNIELSVQNYKLLVQKGLNLIKLNN